MSTELSAKTALVHVAVLNGTARAIYVARREATTLFVGGPGFTDDDPSCFRTIPLMAALELDPSLSELSTLAVGQCAYRHDPSEAWSYGTIPVGSTFLIRYEARPDDSNPARHEVGGAIVNCWVISETMESALHSSATELSHAGWVIVERIHSELVTPLEHGANSFYRQAQVDALVLDVYSFPKGELN